MVRCDCLCFHNSENDRSTNYSENGIVSERHYGCYRLGILIAVAIVLILIIGTVPVFFATDNSKLILIVTIITVIVVGIFVFGYYEWQHRQALNQRDRCREEWRIQSRSLEQTSRERNHQNKANYPDTLNGSSWVFLTIKKPQRPNSSSRENQNSAPPVYSQV